MSKRKTAKPKREDPARAASSAEASNATSGWKDKWPIVRFVLIFALALIGFQVFFLTVIAPSDLFQTYMELCTQASAILLAPSGAEVIADRNNLIFDNRHFLVSEPCAGLQPIAMFCVAVLAFPGSLRAKATAIAVGVSVLLAMNVVRIASLCVIHARSSEETYELFHISLWPMMFILVSMAMWITWARRVLREA